MKRYFLTFLVLSFISTYSYAGKVVKSYPHSEPEKWLFVGNASTDNMFVMFHEAAMDAMNDFFDYYQRICKEAPSDKIEGTCSITFVKYKLVDEVLYVWLEVKPGGKYYFETSISYDQSKSVQQSMSEIDVNQQVELLRLTTVSLNEDDEEMKLHFSNRFHVNTSVSVKGKTEDVFNDILMTVEYESEKLDLVK